MKANMPSSSEMRPGPGFQICKDIIRPPVDVITDFSQFSTPDISDMLNRMYTMCPKIVNQVNNKSIVGCAVTVKVFPGDNLMVHKALDLIQPGDIIVVDASATSTNAVIGDLIASKAKHRGAAGFIIDGLVRDIPDLIDVDLPIFARGKSALGPLHRGPGEINYSVSCGGVVVNPGDIIVADTTGIVVIRRMFANKLLSTLKQAKEQNAEYIKNVKNGNFSNSWVDSILRASGLNLDE